MAEGYDRNGSLRTPSSEPVSALDLDRDVPPIEPGEPGGPVLSPTDLNRPYDTANRGAGDRVTRAKIEYVFAGLTAKGYLNAADLLSHWLNNTGDSYRLNDDQLLGLMEGNQGFSSALESLLVGNRGKEAFDSGWRSTDTDPEESLDWYYALNGFQYRVSGNTQVVQGQSFTIYYIQVYKRYNFGNAQEDRGVLEGGGVRIEQPDLAHLHTVGMARDFDVYGTFTVPVRNS